MTSPVADASTGAAAVSEHWSAATLDDRLRWVAARLQPGLERRFAEGNHDPAAVRLLAKAGLLGLTLPPPYGGLGQDYRGLGQACRELGRLDLSYQITMTVHLALTAMTILQWGSAAQRDRWLPPLAAGQHIGTFALTEPGAGSDVAALRTRAIACAGGHRLSGEKTWISGANDSSLLLVFATIDPNLRHRGITAFLVPKDSRGVRCPPLTGKLGIRIGDTASVVLDDVFVPDENVLGDTGDGFPIALSALATGLFTVGYGALGIIREALSLTISLFANDDTTQSPTASQLHRAQVAAMVAQEASASILLEQAASLKNRGLPNQRETSLAKWTAAAGAVQSAAAALGIAHTHGTPELAPFERHLRNAKGAAIYGGTHEIHQIMQAAYATGHRVDRSFRRASLTAADLADTATTMPRDSA